LILKADAEAFKDVIASLRKLKTNKTLRKMKQLKRPSTAYKVVYDAGKIFDEVEPVS